MQRELQRVLELQLSWTSSNSPEMFERGRLVRTEAVAWLTSQAAELSRALTVETSDFLSEGRDGTGLKTRVPLVRFGSRQRTPSATEGFYVVYLWAFDGSAAYLSLNQGTTDFVNGQFVPKDRTVIAKRVQWAREVTGDLRSFRNDSVEPELRDSGARSLGSGYERGNIAAVRYDRDAVPDDEVLRADATAFAAMLGRLYAAERDGPLPGEIPEVDELVRAAATAAGKPQRLHTAGFLESAADRNAVERQAVRLAVAFYEAAGWTVTTKGAPYDLALRRGQEWRHVEVKGTTSTGDAVVLTRGEVEHHAKAFPNNALVVVSGIRLTRDHGRVTAKGGTLTETHPWTITPDDLQVISYRYRTPSPDQ